MVQCVTPLQPLLSDSCFPLFLLIHLSFCSVFDPCQYMLSFLTQQAVFWPCLFIYLHWVLVAACGIQLPNQGWNLGPCIGSVSLSHWTTWEVPLCMFLKYGSCLPQVVRFHQDRELASAPAAQQPQLSVTVQLCPGLTPRQHLRMTWNGKSLNWGANCPISYFLCYLPAVWPWAIHLTFFPGREGCFFFNYRKAQESTQK